MKINHINKNYQAFSANKDDKINISRDPNNFKNIKVLQDRLTEIIKEIGGIEKRTSMSNDVQIAQAKIKLLKIETKKAWSNYPPALMEKMNRLNKLTKELMLIEEYSKQINKNIKQEPSGIITPKKDKLITDALEIIGIYNSLPKKTQDAKNIISKERVLQSNAITLDELKGSLQELNNNNWDFAKLNEQDSKIFPKLKDQLIIGDIKNLISEQTQTINAKLTELKTKGGKFIPEVGVKIYEPKTMGKIMALETAKLRRSSLNSSVVPPNIDKLSSPDILVQETPAGTILFKLDKNFIPSNKEIKEILELNKPYKPVLEKLFPEGLNVYMVPGYMDDKLGDIEGGLSIPGNPDTGVWLNSYNINDRYLYSSTLENNIASLREIKDFQPSVLQGNKDRARALAHEIGHAVSYKIINNDANNENTSSSSLITLSSAKIDFMSGWLGIRSTAKLNEIDRRESRLLTNTDKANLYLAANYEKVAEDIRMAIVGKNLPATSKMTNLFDHTKEGNSQLSKSVDYIQKCLLQGKSPSEAIIDQIKK